MALLSTNSRLPPCWTIVSSIIFYFVIVLMRYVDGEGVILDVTMPGYTPTEDEQYVCVAAEVTTPGYVVEFLPSATADRTHHMLAYGCNDPVRPPGEAWVCEHAPMCSSSAKIIYAWARNAPALALPQNVGVPIGKSEGIQYVVLQMHFAKKFGGKVFDYSGVRLRITTKQPDYLAGIYLFVPMGGGIPPNTKTYFMNASCEYTFNTDVHPFAFRPHTHHLGRVVSAYKYSKDEKWTKIGKGNPQWPQRFYPIENPVTIQHGDILTAQCVYDSTGRAMATSMGAHGHNEMCNFYMYYYVDAKQKPVLSQFTGCYMNEHSDLFQKYPPEASARFPPNPDMDDMGKQSDMSFGAKETSSWPSSDLTFGQIGGLALDKDNNVIVFHRADRTWGADTFNETDHFAQMDKGPIAENAVIVLSQNGSLVSKWGKSFFYLPHGIFICDHGFLWATDVAMHQVFKFDMKQQQQTDPKPLLTLGQAFEPGSDEKHFCKPAAVAVESGGEGTIFVADGYCNNRIITFAADGRYLRSWGKASEGNGPDGHPPLGTFTLPHGLSLDNSRRRVFVADRENGRVQIFTFDGTPLDQLAEKQFGETVYGLTYCPAADLVFVINGPSVTHDADLRVFAFDGTTERVLYAWSPEKGTFQRPHAVLSSTDCSRVFVGEIGPNKLWRFDIVSSGHRAATGRNEPKAVTSGPGGLANHPRPGHKPSTATDGAVETKKPLDKGADDIDVQSEMRDTVRWMLIFFFGVTVLVLLVATICCCRKCRAKGLQKRNLLDHGSKRNKGSLFTNGLRDLKGFQPLSTEDVDASEDSDDSDTLYVAQKNFVSRKA